MPTNDSTWEQHKDKHDFPELKGEASADVVIVGGGLAGVMLAYQLAKEGKSVAVLEKERVGSGVTAYTTAFVTQYIDTDLASLVKMFGAKNARMVWDSHGSAIDLIEDISKDEKIDCEFMRCSAYLYASSEDDLKDVEEEFETAKKMGLDVELHQESQFSFKNFGMLEIKDQAKFHPLKFLFPLAEKAAAAGVKFYENTEAVSIENGDAWRVATKSGGKASAEHLAVATYLPCNNPKQTYFKKGMYVSYAFEVQLPKGAVPEGLYWDNNNPYNYFRIDKQDEKFDRMVIGGQDHRKEIKMDAEKNFTALEYYMYEAFPGIDCQITRKWSGPILEPSDGLALIGETYPKQYVATAFSGNGMTYSGISSMLITDLIMQRKNAWSEIYDPRRVPSLYQLLKKGKDYTAELLGGAAKNIFKKSS